MLVQQRAHLTIVGSNLRATEPWHGTGPLLRELNAEWDAGCFAIPVVYMDVVNGDNPCACGFFLTLRGEFSPAVARRASDQERPQNV